MEDIRKTWEGLFAAKSKDSIAEWASKNVELPAVLTVRGKFNPLLSPHFIEPLHALKDDHTRQVTILKPVRGGGTLIADLWHCWCRANDPGPAMAVFQSDDIAKQHAEARAMPMLTSVPAIQAVMPGDRHKARNTEIMFADGIPWYITGPGINNLQTKGIRYMHIDELWLYKAGLLEEAKGRLGDYARMEMDKLLIISQAGGDDDDLDLEWRSSTQEEWSVKCAGCGMYFVPKWQGKRDDGSRWGMVWDEAKDDDGRWRVGESVRSVRYVCQCGHEHRNERLTRAEWRRNGKYSEPKWGGRKHRGFRWNAIISDPWPSLVEQFLNAMNALKDGLPDPLIRFFQKKMAEPKSEGSVVGAAVDLRQTSYTGSEEWASEFVRFMTVDRQLEDLYWVTIRAWTQDGRSRRLYFGKVYGEAALKKLAVDHKCKHVFVDSGYMPKGDHGVYAICANNDWVAFKGTDESGFVHQVGRGLRVMRSFSPVTSGDAEQGRRLEGQNLCKLVRFSAPVMAERVKQLIASGKWEEPITAEDDPLWAEYQRQMSSEYKKKKTNKFTGKSEWVWVCPSGNNHAFDCAKMQVCAATIAELLPDMEADEPVKLTAEAMQ